MVSAGVPSASAIRMATATICSTLSACRRRCSATRVQTSVKSRGMALSLLSGYSVPNTGTLFPFERGSSMDVVIVGGGTVGLCTAVFLARQGVSVRVLERRPTVSDHPRAFGLNPRSAEIVRWAGIEFETDDDRQ